MKITSPKSQTHPNAARLPHATSHSLMLPRCCTGALPRCVALASLVSLTWLNGGCGGGSTTNLGGGTAGPGSNAATTKNTATGRATFKIIWPKRTTTAATSRLIPADSNSIQVGIVASDGTLAGTQLLTRPAGSSASTTASTGSFTLPVGFYTVVAAAFPSTDGSGTAQATGSVPLAIVSNDATPFTLTMGSTISTLAVTPAGPSVAPGATLQMVATAYDATGAVVLLSPTGITWSVTSGSAATIDPVSGLLTAGVSNGTVTVTATDPESAQFASTTVTVSYPIQYTATDIGNPGTGYLLADYGNYGGGAYNNGEASINASGQVASTWEDSSGVYHSFLYTPGSGFQDLGGITPAGTTYHASYASGINDSGAAVGSSVDANDESHAVLFSGGTVQDLGLLAGAAYQYAYASAINARGQVAGTSETSTYTYHAFLNTNGTFQDLGSLNNATSYNESYASALNASGQVVGEAYTANGTYHAFLYSNGTMQDLGTLSGATSDYSYASSINASGQVVGGSYASDGIYHGFLYSSGTMQNIDTLAGIGGSTSYYSYANSINDSGQIVGYDENSSTSYTYGAFVYSNGVLQNLNDITSGLSGLTLYSADHITNNGLILAEAVDSNAVYHLVVLSPVSGESRAKHPLAVLGKHARGITKDRLPKWMLQRPPFTKAMPRRLHSTANP